MREENQRREGWGWGCCWGLRNRSLEDIRTSDRRRARTTEKERKAPGISFEAWRGGKGVKLTEGEEREGKRRGTERRKQERDRRKQNERGREDVYMCV
jgi:hypothetical protein